MNPHIAIEITITINTIKNIRRIDLVLFSVCPQLGHIFLVEERGFPHALHLFIVFIGFFCVFFCEQ